MMDSLPIDMIPPPSNPLTSSTPPLPKPSLVSPKKAATQTPSHPGRNIEKVVFGSLCFKTWYPSYYNKELLQDHHPPSGTNNNHTTTGKDHGGKEGGSGGTGAAAVDASFGSTASSTKTATGGGKQKGEAVQSVIERLYICPSCFKYSRELVPWWGHVQVCEKRGRVPGRKVYVHPRGREEDGEWSIWEVDGDEEGLFCQNLSLFGKLFLDNKSIFFDTSGFLFFLLVYTPPSPPSSSSSPSSTTTDTNATHPQLAPLPQITAFFSKEKLSWDANNLACILVFPPWQRKGLGALLMAASYEISKRERVMGGPEKPISELGLRGYKRYWGGEIARWLLSKEPSSGSSTRSRGGSQKRETIVDIQELSQEVWIWPEDCLFTLKEMGVYEDIGLGPGKPPPKSEEDDDAMEEQEEEEEKGKEVKLVNRVRIDLEGVRRFVAVNGISLERLCDPEGFVEGYAVKEETEGEDEEEDDDDEDEDME